MEKAFLIAFTAYKSYGDGEHALVKLGNNVKKDGYTLTKDTKNLTIE